MPYFFYILRCNDNSLYSGVTIDLERRVLEHNSDNKKGAKYTKSRRPVKLVYSEEYDNVQSAMKREYEVKQWSKVKKEQLIK